MRRAYKRDIIAGASIGIGIGLLLVLGIVLIGYPRRSVSPVVQPVPVTTSVSASLPTPNFSLAVTPSLSPTQTPTPIVITYTVQEGDNLFEIALAHNTTVEAIKAANGLTSDVILPGQVLVISPATSETLPTPTPHLEGGVVIHVVAFGETLTGIAGRYGVTVESIQSANGLTSDAIEAGQELIIPLEAVTATTPVAEPSAHAWAPSILEGDLAAAYPLELETDRFTLHYQPDSLPAQQLDTVVTMVETALTHIESTLHVNLEGSFDAYAAGSLFAPPNLALRGRSFSSQRRFFFLYDGTGTPADRQYIVTHELTHLMTWNTMGRPASVMLHEGVAVYVGMELAENGGYIPIEVFCAAYHQVGRLPSLSISPSFQGHIRDLDTYYAAGCFVQYLIEKYGVESFAEVYHTGDYYGVYGRSLADLEAEWKATVESSSYSLPVDPDRLVYYVTEVAAAYDRLFTGFAGTPVQLEAYRTLDRARTALLEGNLDETESRLRRFEQLLSRTAEGSL